MAVGKGLEPFFVEVNSFAESPGFQTHNKMERRVGFKPT